MDLKADMDLLELLYVSTAQHIMLDQELKLILEQSRAYNSQNNVTGMLIYSNGAFMQLLEGKPEEVINLYNKISRDPRHEKISKIYERETDSRRLGEWSMGYLSQEDLSKMKMPPGYKDLSDPNFNLHQYFNANENEYFCDYIIKNSKQMLQ